MQQASPLLTELVLGNVAKVIATVQAMYASSTLPPDEPAAKPLQSALIGLHDGLLKLRSCCEHLVNDHAVQSEKPAANQLEDGTETCRRRTTPPTLPITASAVLTSEPGRAVWQMLGGGHWLPVASVSRGMRAAYMRELLWGDSSGRCGLAWVCRTELTAVLQSDALFRMALDLHIGAHVAGSSRIKDDGLRRLLERNATARGRVGRAQLSCGLVRDAVAAGLPLDAHTLTGAAVRGCETALNEWHALLSSRDEWREQEAWALPVMALAAVDTDCPATLEALRWVFRAATQRAGESACADTPAVQLPPLLLTALAFKCAALGKFEWFRWLHTHGRQLIQQSIQAQVPVTNLNAFRQALGPYGAGGIDLLFMLVREGTAFTHTLMDTAIIAGQEDFAAALSTSGISAPLSSFTDLSASATAAFGSLSLLQRLHAHPNCAFNNAVVITGCMVSCSQPPPGAAVEASESGALEVLRWLRGVGAFEAVSQTDLSYTVVKAAVAFAVQPRASLRVRLLWLLQEEARAVWPAGGAARFARVETVFEARHVVNLVSELGCPWGPWTSAECAVLRDRTGPSNAPAEGSTDWMRRLHELGCPCACTRPAGSAAAARGGGDA
eukprot:TRINITY_DN2687_c0_g2_i1.p1 TRINITY_DN2687_c0_g2~~TRINITY_DN2687_c0_g2_i1.p1  ORF type:complete len:669 (+),score=156.74 TRINITY_DN2687_c0_g2_i1:173-2008(+)